MARTESKTPSAEGILAAAKRVEGHIVITPLIENEVLNETVDARILLKAEPLQRGGAFKIRGAYNLLSRLPEDIRRRGVVAWSSGNHAQGIAIAAKAFRCPAVIVMPADAPRIKTDRVRALGAEVVTYDRYTEDREAIGLAICEDRQMTLAPSFDHVDIMEGQGTLALETVEQAATMGASLDAFAFCCGGGGLTAGCATILEEISPETKVWIAEPEKFDEGWASIEAGERQIADVTEKTLCDAIATPSLGRLTFPILQRRVSAGASVSDEDVKAAMRFAFLHLKIVLEPGGAAALAGVLSRKFPVSGKTVAVTLSGGNVDPTLFASILGEERPGP